MLRSLTFVLGALLVSLTASQSADPPKLPKELAIIPADGLGFISVNVDQLRELPLYKGLLEGLAKSAVQEDIQSEFGLKIEEISRVTIILAAGPQQRPVDRFEGQLPQFDQVYLFTTRKPLDKAAIIRNAKFAQATERGAFATQRAFEARKEAAFPGLPADVKQPLGKEIPGQPPLGKEIPGLYTNRSGQSVKFVDDRTIAFTQTGGGSRSQDPLNVIKPLFDQGPLHDYAALAEKHPIAFGFCPQQMMTPLSNIPYQLSPYWAVLRADHIGGFVKLTDKTAEIKITGDYPVNSWAENAEGSTKQQLPAFARLIRQVPMSTMEYRPEFIALRKQLLEFSTMLMKAKVQRNEKTLTVEGNMAVDTVLGEFMATIPVEMARAGIISKSSNNLKQIGLSFLNFESANGFFPSQNDPKTGKPHLSWRVHLLPYVEESNLYRQFKMDEPWDSENNKKLIAKMPKVYIVPGAKAEEGHTYYRSFISKKGNSWRAVFHEGDVRGTRIADISDGTSNTFRVAEAAESCIWTKPDDLVVDPKGDAPKLGDHYKKGIFLVAMCDGSVRQVKLTTAREKLMAAISRDGGEVLTIDD